MSWPHLPEPVPVSGQRDLSHLSDQDRWAIARMATHERQEQAKVADGVGEFHESAVVEDYDGSSSDSLWV